MLVTLGAGAFLGQSTARAADDSSLVFYFPQTGHHLSGVFLKTWQADGGLMTFGYPLTEPIQQDGTTVQYFERARFEYHPNNPEPYTILLGRLTTDAR